MSEDRGCLGEGCLGVPGVLPDVFRFAIFPRKRRKRRQEPELPDLAWNSQTSFSQTSAIFLKWFEANSCTRSAANCRKLLETMCTVKPLPLSAFWLRAQRLKKINLASKFSISLDFFQSRIEFSISELPNYHSPPPQKKMGVWWAARLKLSISLENFNPGGRSWIFSTFGPLGGSGAEETNKHKQLSGIVPGMGGGQNCLCVAFLLGKKRTHRNKFPGNLRKMPGQSRETFVYVFPCFFFFPALNRDRV